MDVEERDVTAALFSGVEQILRLVKALDIRVGFSFSYRHLQHLEHQRFVVYAHYFHDSVSSSLTCFLGMITLAVVPLPTSLSITTSASHISLSLRLIFSMPT